jgi:hypothetical protein
MCPHPVRLSLVPIHQFEKSLYSCYKKKQRFVHHQRFVHDEVLASMLLYHDWKMEMTFDMKLNINFGRKVNLLGL